MKKAIVTLAVAATLGLAAPALAGPKPPASGGRTTTTTTITNGGRHFK